MAFWLLSSLSVGALVAATAGAQERLPAAKPAPLTPAQRDVATRELHFARLAAKNGDTRLALSLYERIVARDPANRRAFDEMVALAAPKTAARPAPVSKEYRELASRAAKAPADADLQLRLAGEAAARGDQAQAMRAYHRAMALTADNRQQRGGTMNLRDAQAMMPPPAADPKPPSHALAVAPAPAPAVSPAPPAVAAPAPARALAPALAPRPAVTPAPVAARAPVVASAPPPAASRVPSPVVAPAPAHALAPARAPEVPSAPAPSASPALATVIAPATARAVAPSRTLAPAVLPAPAPAQAAAPPTTVSSAPAPAPVPDVAPTTQYAQAPSISPAPAPAPGPALAESPKDAEYRRLFDEIMRDPTNVDANLRYAKMAIDRGEPRKAMPAYERVLSKDPNNAEAKAGVEDVRIALEPSITQWTVALGAYYESNPKHFRQQSSATHAATIAGRANLFDERRIHGIRWRTEAETFFTWHSTFRDLDYGLIGARTGPVFTVNENLRINPFLGGGYTWLAKRSFYFEATGGVSFEFEKLLPLHSIAARFGYQDIGQHISTRNALFVEVAPRFLFQNVGYTGTAAWINPYWRYSGVLGSGQPGFDQRTDPFPARSHQLGVRGDYFMPITSQLTVGVSAGYEYRHYFEAVFDGLKNRRDHLVSPGIQAIITGVGDERFGIVVSYGFEHRFSNDALQIYSNHSAGVRFTWRN